MSKAYIEWVNHAGFIIHHEDIHLMIDPWISESAFDDGWDLISPSKFQLENFKRVTHIWFSHEHPDHFNPTLIRKIPEEFRKKIKVLFQTTEDRRVVKFCEKFGFKVIELEDRKWLTLSDEFEILTGKNGELDSWLFAKVDGQTILNLNDCIFLTQKELEEVKSLTGSPDALFSIFSFAEKVGNNEQVELRQKEARRQLKMLKAQTETFKPKFIIPCAAFKYFSHEENCYLNVGSNTIVDAYKALEPHKASIRTILYPGDLWSFKPVESEPAISKYMKDWSTIHHRLRALEGGVDLAKLSELAKSYAENLLKLNNCIILKILSLLPGPFSISSIVIHLTDKDVDICFNPIKGIDTFDKKQTHSHLQMSSVVLRTILGTAYGCSTVLNNGRFQADKKGLQTLYNLSHIGLLNRNNKKLSWTYMIINFLRAIRTLSARQEYA